MSTAGSARGPSPVSTTGTATSTPGRRSARPARCRRRRRQPTIAAGSSAASSDDGAAERGAAPGGLDDERQPESADHARPAPRRRRARGTSPRAGTRPSAVSHAGATDHGLGDRLVEGEAAGGGAGADVGDAEQLEHLPDRAVLAGSPWSTGSTQAGGSSWSRVEQRRVDVALLDVVARVPQRLGDPTTGAQRHVALVGQAAGEHQHASGHGQLRHVRSVLGPS